MISLDEFYINYKIIVESAVKKLISESIQTALVSTYNDRGAYNASNDQFPSSGGSGAAGAIMAGDTWVIDADGSPGGVYLNIGDTIRAAVDNPTQNLADWTIINTGFGYTPLNKEGDTITGINGSGYLGLTKQATDPSTPTNGVKLFSNADGHLTYINEDGNVIDFDDVLSLLSLQSNGLLFVDMQADDNILTAEESKNTIFILTNVGDGSKKLTLTDSNDVPSFLTFYVFDNNPVNISLSGNTFNKTVKPQTPLQVIYRTTASIALNYVTFDNLITPGWATKVHFNEFGLIDNSSTISTADVLDSLNKRYVTDAEKQIIQDFIAAGGDAVPPTRTINGYTLENDIVLTKTDLSLGNVDNTSDLNKPISTATQSALDNKEDKSNKGVANGYTPLDNANKIPLSYLPDSVVGALKFKGFWNAATNVIISGDSSLNGQPIPPASSSNEGWYFIVQTEGTSVIDGQHDWQQRDWIISIGTSWQELDNVDAVWSVNGYEGIVTLQTGDVPDEENFRYVTDAEKTKLSNLSGVNTGDQSLSDLGGVPTTRTVNGKALTSDINILPIDIGLGNIDNTADVDKPVSTFQQTALNAKQSLSEKGQPSGYPPLNESGKIPSQYLPASGGGDGVAGAIKYMGTWNASTNVCSSSDVGVDNNPLPIADVDNEGWYFIISNAGSTEIDSIDDWKVNDWIVSIGSQWIKNNNSGSSDTFDHSTLQLRSEKGQPNGYVPLNGSGKIDNGFLPPGSSDFNFKEEFYEVKAIDVTNKYITLEETPIDDTRINLLVYGGTHQRPLIDFVVSDNILSWSGLALETLIDDNSYLYITYEY
jgi:hypothetical protein